MARGRPSVLASNAIDGTPRGEFVNLPQRIWLTYQYHGLQSVIWRTATFPLRFTPLGSFVRVMFRPEAVAARRWYRMYGHPVSIVVPSFRDADRVAKLSASIRRTTDRDRVTVIIADDASGRAHVRALRRIEGVHLVLGSENRGFAANVNRALRAANPEHDIVILNSDVIVRPGWLAGLQYAATHCRDVGIVGGKLLYRTGRIQFAGTIRSLWAPEWFDHRYRFLPAGWGPADIPQSVLAVTGACMYVTRDVIDRIGPLDESYLMGYEDVDFCLRAWQAGSRVMYWPTAELRHDESVTRGKEFGKREQRSQAVFWRRWSDFFDSRNVRTADGALRVIYVTEGTGVGGGHRQIFEHLNRLLERGHDAELWTLAGEPEWFDLRAPVRSFDDYNELARALTPLDAIKVATWWRTAEPVWDGSVLHGIPVYLVQDIETSYFARHDAGRNAVLASYRHEFRYMAVSSWIIARLREMGLNPALISPGIDLQTFRPLRGVERRPATLLAVGRSNPLKDLPLTIAAWRMPHVRPELCLYGVEPDVVTREPGVRYVVEPSDEAVNRLFNEATVFVQTSRHEGFGLPILEAMATGCPVVCTDADGNRDFCTDGVNCLMPQATPEAISAALSRLLGDADLRRRLGRAGIETAAGYDWTRTIDALEHYLTSIAAPRTLEIDRRIA